MTTPPVTLGIADYVVFALFLAISLGIGIYFSLAGDRQRTTSEFLLGNRSLRLIPVAISIFVTFHSAISILGASAEIYSYGAIYWLLVVGQVLGMLVAAFLFVPLFYRLKVTSVNAYLEDRFKSRAVRLFASILNILITVLFMGLAMLAPSLAFNTATGFPVWAIIIITALVATVYTSIGGMKAVIWTDTFQGIILFGGLLAIVIKAVIDAGGFGEIWRVGVAEGRITAPEMIPDPRIRHSFWTMTIGVAPVMVMVYGTAQPSVQRMISLPSQAKATKAMLLNIPAIIVSHSVLCITALAVFTYYASKAKCDILAAKIIRSPNEVLPYYVMDKFRNIPGFSGVFLAVLYSGALSSVSSGLSANAAIVWEDFCKPFIGKTISDKGAAVITKLIVLLSGLVATGFGIAASFMGGTIIQMTITLLGCIAGPKIGIFMLGFFFPWANAKGTIIGAILGYVMPVWIALGRTTRKLHWPKLPPFTTEGCSSLLGDVGNTTMSHLINLGNTSTVPTTQVSQTFTTSLYNVSSDAVPVAAFPPRGALDNLYMTSYLYYALIGFTGTIMWGLIFSFITGATNPEDVDPKYMVPIFDRLCCCLSSPLRRKCWCGVRYDDDDDIDEDTKDNLEDVTSSLLEVRNGKGTTDPGNPIYIGKKNGEGFEDSDTRV